MFNAMKSLCARRRIVLCFTETGSFSQNRPASVFLKTAGSRSNHWPNFTARYRGYFPVEFDPTLEKGHQLERRRQDAEEDCVDELKSILGRNLANLNEVEARVIRARFAIDEEVTEVEVRKGKTLEQVGEMIGVTKERVRQIQNKALGKLRTTLEQGILAV